MLTASRPSSLVMASAASTIASRLRADFAGRSRRLRGGADMPYIVPLDGTPFVTYSVRHEQCSLNLSPD
jgi:hypothetical protein